MEEIETSERATELLETRRGELVRILEALDTLGRSEEWKVLTELVFGREVASIERRLLTEAKSKEPSLPALHRLQGELAWARRYFDTSSYAEQLRKQLQDIKNRTK